MRLISLYLNSTWMYLLSRKKSRIFLPSWFGTILLFGLFGVPSIARAGEISMTLTSGGNILDGNVYAGPYTAHVSGQTVLIICDNYDTDVNVPLTWNATLTQFATNGTTGLKLDGLETTGKSDLQNYEAAAWLAQQIYADYIGITPSNKSAMDQAIGDLNYALWAIFSSAGLNDTGVSTGFDAGAAEDYAAAIKGNYSLSQFSDVEFWTPDPSGASQEYLTITPAPEPASLLLFGSGLLAIAGVLRKKRLA
jgi:hypothetical protein